MSDPSNVIAIVDDDKDVREVLSALFELSGYEVETFGSGAGFLEQIGFDRFACLVVDLKMPGMTGLELVAKLGIRGTRIPTLLITGATNEEVRRQAANSGIMTGMQKPISHRKLLRFAALSTQ
jgi:two-component system response regulator FixJ